MNFILFENFIYLDDKFQQDLVDLQNQCTQLDTANRAWQIFYGNQINLLKDKFKDFIQFDDNLNFEDIIQLIASELEKGKLIHI